MVNKSTSFYEYCNALVSEYNNKMNNFKKSDVLIDIHHMYVHGSNINILYDDKTVTLNEKDNGGFFITSTFNNFINGLNFKRESGKTVDFIKEVMYLLFNGKLKNSHYNNLYLKIFKNIKTIKESNDGYIIINSKQEMKFGKFVSMVIKCLDLSITGSNLSNGIEQFIDEYKSWYNTKNIFKFVILRGEEILNGYDRYYHYKNGYGSSLSNSCMNNKSNFLNLYTNNENKVMMLSLQCNGKIYGRCLIWNLNSPNIIYMDRIYGVENYITNIFEEFAKEHKWSFRLSSNNDGVFTIFYYDYDKNDYVYDRSNVFNYKVKLDVRCIDKYPYMDSFKIMNRSNNYFYLNIKNNLYLNYNTLQRVDGRVKQSLLVLGIKVY